tara:strand:- start:203 stop:451 length:249 start_codon:yes stop_codon:yes gene_type:complete
MAKIRNPLFTSYIIMLSFFFTSPAYAYLDPGTGSLILQGIIAGLAMLSITIKMWWHTIISWFKKSEDSKVIKNPTDEPEVNK